MRVGRWLVSFLIALTVVALVEFPRGVRALPQHATVIAPIVLYKWADYRANLLELWYRIAHLAPGDIAVGGQSIAQVVTPAWLKSLELMGIALCVAIIFGLSKALFDGLQQWRRPKLVLATGIVQWVFEAMPNFFLILLLELISFNLLQYGIRVSFVGTGAFWSMTLVPAALIAIGPGAYVARMMRLSVEDQLGQPYWVTARSKGLRSHTLLQRHVLPNAISALVDAGPMVVGLLFTNLVMVEYLMDEPGVTAALFSGMGQQGVQPVYWPVNDVPSRFEYQPYDPQLTLTAIVGCVILFVLMVGVIRLFARACGYRGVRNTYAGIHRETPSGRSRSVLIWTGMVTMGAMVLAGAGVDLFQKYNPNDQSHWDALEHIGNSLATPPFPPSWHHLLGTDARGRDLLVETLHGILPTFTYVLIPVVAIMILATGLGLLGGLWQWRSAQWLLQLWNGTLSYIPRALVMLLILNIPDIFWIGSSSSINHIRWGILHQVVYMALLVVVETGAVASALQSRIVAELSKEYLEAAWVSGNSRWSAFRRHIWPAFRLVLLQQFTSECGAVLLLVATLGFFQNPIHQEFLDLQGPPFPPQWVFVPASLDFAGLISENARDVLGSPWVIAAPVLFVTITVLAINLVREGLQQSGGTDAVVRRKQFASEEQSVDEGGAERAHTPR